MNKTIVKLIKTPCILDQNAVADIIQQRTFEIRVGAPKILMCDLYQQLLANDPRMIFIDYTQINKLQKTLAEHYRPELLVDSPTAISVGSEKKIQVFLRYHDSDGEENALKVDT